MGNVIELSYNNTKILGLVIICILSFVNLFRRNVNYFFFFGCMFFFISCFPLGHDTLNYKFIIEDGYLPRYGIIWQTLYIISTFIKWWKIVHIISYSLILLSFFLLSKSVKQSALLFTSLVLSPAIGIDFLSIVRQGLATAFLIFGFLMRNRKSKLEYLFYFIAILTHVTSIVFPLYLLILKLIEIQKKSITRFFILGLTFFVLFCIAIIFIVKFELIDPVHFLEFYVLSKDGEPGGNIIFFYWMFILGLPVILKIILYNEQCGREIIFYALFFLLYYVFLQISSPLGRLFWYILPVLLYNSFLSIEKYDSLNKIHFIHKHILISSNLVASFYGILISHENYWFGFYE